MKERVVRVNRVWLAAVLVMLGTSVAVAWLQRVITDEGVLLFLNQVMIFIPSLIYLLVRGNPAETIGVRRIPLVTVPMLILLMVLLLPLISTVNLLSMFFAENLIGQTAESVLAGHSLLMSVVMIALVPAVFEEILFRGIIYHDGYRHVSPVKGMLLCGLMFGLLHMNLNQFCYAFLLGAVLCAVFEATGSILSTMIMHFTLNAYSTLSLYAVQALGENEELAAILGEAEEAAEMTPEMIKETLLSILPVAVVTTILAYALLQAIAKKCGRKEHLRAVFAKQTEPTTTWEAWEEPEKKPSLITPAWVIASLLCLGVMLMVQFAGSIDML